LGGGKKKGEKAPGRYSGHWGPGINLFSKREGKKGDGPRRMWLVPSFSVPDGGGCKADHFFINYGISQRKETGGEKPGIN